MDKRFSLQTYTDLIKHLFVPTPSAPNQGVRPARDWLILLVVMACLAVFFTAQGLTLFSDVQAQHDTATQKAGAGTEVYAKDLKSTLADISAQQGEFEALKTTPSPIADPNK